MKNYLAGLLVAVFVLPISNASAQDYPSTASAAGINDNARIMFERYGSTDGSDTLEQAYARGTISGYHTRRTIGAVPSLTARTAVPSSDVAPLPVIETVGTAFRVLSDGTQFFETEGRPVAVKPNGSVHALTDNHDAISKTAIGTLSPNHILSGDPSGRKLVAYTSDDGVVSHAGETPGTTSNRPNVGATGSNSEVTGVSSWGQTTRNFDGVTTYGEPFRTLADGTRLFETEGPAVAVGRDGVVYETVGGQPQYDKVLAGAPAVRDVPNVAATGSNSEVTGVSSWGQTTRNFDGVTTYGEPFRTLADGTRLFETEGLPVAVGRDGVVYETAGGQPQYDKVLAGAPAVRDVLTREVSDPTTNTSFADAEMDKARQYFEAYGSTGSSSFEEAFNNQTIIGYSTDYDGLGLDKLAEERARARSFFNTYGSADGSDTFEQAFQRQAIPGYSAPLAGTSLTTLDRVTNKYTTGRFSEYTDSSYRTASTRGSTVSPYDFGTGAVSSSRNGLSLQSRRASGTGFSLAKSPDEIRQLRATRAAARSGASN